MVEVVLVVLVFGGDGSVGVWWRCRCWCLVEVKVLVFGGCEGVGVWWRWCWWRC